MTKQISTPICFAPAIHGAEKYHEQWFLVGADNHCLTAQDATALDQVSLRLHMRQLQLRAPGMLRLELLLDVLEDDDEVRCQVTNLQGQTMAAIDEGDVAAVWFTHILGRPCRLVKKDPGHPDR